jgi:ParB family transcriptional regulator, chromosome partitioning protein
VELQIKKPKANGSTTKQPAIQKPCEKMTEAIVMDGGNRGQIVKVCADGNCRVHHADRPSPQQLQRDRAIERRRIEKEKIAITARHRILAALLERVSVPLKKGDLLTIAEHILTTVPYNRLPLLAKRHKVELEKSGM